METVPLKVTTTRVETHFDGATVEGVQSVRRIYKLLMHTYRRLQSVKMSDRRSIYQSASFCFITSLRKEVEKEALLFT